RALTDAGIAPGDVDYINAHGTATEQNDEVEAEAIRQVFGIRGSQMPVGSTKSMLGHALGASGAMEFVICVAALRDGFVPPTINGDEPDPDIGHDYVPHRGRQHDIRVAVSNSFAFGGNNSVLVLRRAS